MKDLYVSQYNKLPEKTVVNLVSQEGKELLRTVAVYPDAFLPYMDRLIVQYIQRLKQAEAQNKS